MTDRFRPPMVTFTISLPAGGTFEDYVLAIRTARQVQIDAGNIAAAQAVSVVAGLAEGGKIAFETSVTAPQLVASATEGNAALIPSDEANERDIIQLAPSHHWAGCLAVVEEVRSWGVTAYVQLPGPCDGVVAVVDTAEGDLSVRAYIRLEWGEFSLTGGTVQN